MPYTFAKTSAKCSARSQYRNDSIVIHKDGKPVAALVDAELFARIRRMRDLFDTLSSKVADDFATPPPK